MFGSFTWANYFYFVGFLLFVYYLNLGICYYKKEVCCWFGKKESIQEAMISDTKKRDLLPMVHELVSELGLVIRKASETCPPVPELLFALQSRIRDFSLLESTEYKGKINLYIAEELEIHGLQGIALEDIENLWKA